jgi:hypothetical protein
MPYSYLNVEQFKKAKRALSRWNGTASFVQRIRTLEQENTVTAKAEWKILKELYQQGAKSEAANSN